MIAAIYARKSTEQTGVHEDAKSVTRQVDRATEYATRHGWTVDPDLVFVDDAVSGAEFERRPGLSRLVAGLTPRRFDVLIMSEDSRLGRHSTRTASLLESFLDSGVRVFFYLDDREVKMGNALGRAMTSLAGIGADLERERGQQRTLDALHRKASAGFVAGGLVYGYENIRVGSNVERRPHPVEADVVRRIFQLYADGTGPRGIVETLRTEGAPPPKPRQSGATPGWSRAAVLEMLKRDLYRGVMVWGQRQKVDRHGRTKVRITRESALVTRPDETLRIVPEDLWLTVQTRRRALADARPAGTWTRSEAKPALLAGVAVCATCGTGITRVSRSHGSSPHRRRVLLYGCGRHVRNRSQCDNAVALPEEVLDQQVLIALGNALSPSLVEAALDLALREHTAEQETAEPRRRQLDRELAAVARRIDRLTEAVAAGTGATSALLPKLAAEEGRRRELERDREALDVAASTVDLFSAKVRKAIVKAAGEVKAALLDDRAGAAEVLRAFLPRLTCTPFGTRHGRG